MTQDIYTNTSAFGLMSEEMQAQMKAHPGAWEVFDYEFRWFPLTDPAWDAGNTYRAVRPPEPPKVYEAWGVAKPNGLGWLSFHETEIGARIAMNGLLTCTVIRLTGSKKDE